MQLSLYFTSLNFTHFSFFSLQLFSSRSTLFFPSSCKLISIKNQFSAVKMVKLPGFVKFTSLLLVKSIWYFIFDFVLFISFVYSFIYLFFFVLCYLVRFCYYLNFVCLCVYQKCSPTLVGTSNVLIADVSIPIGLILFNQGLKAQWELHTSTVDTLTRPSVGKGALLMCLYGIILTN